MECLHVAEHQLANLSLNNHLNNNNEPVEFSSYGGSLVGHGPNSGTSSRPPTKFSDPSNIVPPANLHELVNQLHAIFDSDDVNVEYVQKLMTSYKSNRKEWRRYAKFDPHRYTRNLVDAGNGKFNLMILCWNEAQGSSIHSHANSHCFLKVLDGSVTEELYEWPTNQEENDNSIEGNESGMKKWAENQYSVGQCAYINDNIGLHRVENCSHTDKAVTLHLYSPPFDECQCFDQRTGRATVSKVTFWSKYGRRTPFGRNPEQTPGCCVVENN
ncbi:cysteine dioxygenase type 1-like [Physella acuta]|uniref:cysteine dioxygenase type 1-like n=1 Tax=Physella acuta TaxID=109671 RepID=UPI0027DBC278|nr:cysteine dioxygenase type 1-like [Physella acuta]